MAEAIMSMFSACCGSRKSKNAQQQQADENTPLIDPDVLPSAPIDQVPVLNNEEEQAHQDALRKIVDEASDRLVNISSESPASQLYPNMCLHQGQSDASRWLQDGNHKNMFNPPQSFVNEENVNHNYHNNGHGNTSVNNDNTNNITSETQDRSLRNETSNHSLRTIPSKSSPPKNLNDYDDNEETPSQHAFERAHSRVNGLYTRSETNTSTGSDPNPNLNRIEFEVVTTKEDEYMKRACQLIEEFYSRGLDFSNINTSSY